MKKAASDPTALAEAMRQRRLSAGLSQSEVAIRLGVAQPTVSNWEIGKTRPSAAQIKQLEGFLGDLATTRAEQAAEPPPAEASPFGVWLNATRTRKGLTVPELASKAGLSPVAIYNLESGRVQNPQKATRESLATALGEKPADDTVRATEEASAIEGLGNLVDFDPHVDASLPEGAGVYVFYDISQRPVYVGESGDMKARIKGHGDRFWFKRPIVEYGSYIEIKSDKLRKQTEKILIRFLKSNAVLNKQHVERTDE